LQHFQVKHEYCSKTIAENHNRDILTEKNGNYKKYRIMQATFHQFNAYTYVAIVICEAKQQITD